MRGSSAALERGLACYPAGGTVDGVRGDHVLLAPRYSTTAGEIDMIVDRLAAGVIGSMSAYREEADSLSYCDPT